MPRIRSLIALTLTAAVLVTGASVAIPSTFAQDPPNAGAGQNKGKDAANNKKKAARRRPRGNGAVGVIVPYPMPPVLIIRQTPEAHDEIQALLNMLRYE
jgi:hypothetical protein